MYALQQKDICGSKARLATIMHKALLPSLEKVQSMLMKCTIHKVLALTPDYLASKPDLQIGS